MLSRVLVAMDDSEMAEEALRYALEAYPEADITVLTVVGEPSQMMWGATALATADNPQEKAEELARPVADRAREIAAERDVEISTATGMGHPARVILDRSEDFDTVVLGSHGGTMADRLIIGNVAKTVFNRAPVPVTVVR
jgi:nucleotide-binding universal stress UspA family protein